MAHIIKCIVCGETFDTDKEQGVKCGSRRYAHLRCYPEGELVPMRSPASKKEMQPKKEENLDKEVYHKKILDFVRDNFITQQNYPLIQEQIKKMILNGYTYKGIYRSLVFHYKVRKGSEDKSKGAIGIVPYVYIEANKYFDFLESAIIRGEEAPRIVEEKKIIKIKEPIPIRRFDLFDLD